MFCNFLQRRSPANKVQLSTVFRLESAITSFENSLFFSHPFSIPATSEMGLKNWITYTFIVLGHIRKTCGALLITNSPWCSDRCRHIISFSIVPRKVAGSGSSVLQNLANTSVIHSTDFYFVLSIILIRRRVVETVKICFSVKSTAIMHIALVL